MWWLIWKSKWELEVSRNSKWRNTKQQQQGSNTGLSLWRPWGEERRGEDDTAATLHLSSVAQLHTSHHTSNTIISISGPGPGWPLPPCNCVTKCQPGEKWICIKLCLSSEAVSTKWSLPSIHFWLAGAQCLFRHHIEMENRRRVLLIVAETTARDAWQQSDETSVTVSLQWQWAAVTSAHLWPAEEQVAAQYSTVLYCAVLYCAVVTVQNMQQYSAQSECDLDHDLPVTSYTPHTVYSIHTTHGREGGGCRNCSARPELGSLTSYRWPQAWSLGWLHYTLFTHTCWGGVVT